MTRMGRAASDTPVPRPSGARARPIPENTPHTDSTENTMNTNPWQLALHIDATGTVASAAHTTAAGNVETLTTPIDPRAAVTSAIEGHGRPPTELVIVHDGPPPEQLATALASDLGIPVELMTTAEALAHYRNRTGNGGPAESHPIVAFAGGDQYDASRVPPLGALVAGPGSLGAVAAPAGTQQSPGATTPPRPRSADAHPRATGRARSRTASILPASLQPYTRLVAIAAAAVAIIVVVLAFAGMCSSSDDRVINQTWQVTEVFDDPTRPTGPVEGEVPLTIVIGEDDYTVSSACGEYGGDVDWLKDHIVRFSVPKEKPHERDCHAAEYNRQLAAVLPGDQRIDIDDDGNLRASRVEDHLENTAARGFAAVPITPAEHR